MAARDELERLARRIASGDPDAARRAAALLGGVHPRVVWIVLSETSWEPEGARGDTDSWAFSTRDEAMRFAAGLAEKEVVPRTRRRLGRDARAVRDAFEAGDWFGVMRAACNNLLNRDERMELTVHARRLDPEDGLLGCMPEPVARRWCGYVELLIWPHVAWTDVGTAAALRWQDAPTSYSVRASGLYVGKRLAVRGDYAPSMGWWQTLPDPVDPAALDEVAARVIGRIDDPALGWGMPTSEDRRHGEWREFDGGSRIEPVIRRARPGEA